MCMDRLQYGAIKYLCFYNGYILKLRYTILQMCIILLKLLSNCSLGKFQ